jgi:hypothetical protein
MDYAGTSDLWVVGCSKVFTLGFTNRNLYISFSSVMYQNIPTVKQQIRCKTRDFIVLIYIYGHKVTT